MAATMVPQKTYITGVKPTYNAATGAGDSFANLGRTILIIKNDDADTDCTVSIPAAVKCSLGYDHDGGCKIPFGEERVFGPFSPTVFNDPETGFVTVNYDEVSGGTGVTVACIELP
jgi:hypothetical protein